MRKAFGIGFAIVLGTYVLSDVWVSASLSARHGKWHLWPRLLAAFPCMHFAWALGLFNGLIGGLHRKVPDRPHLS
jgi:hypothetical protein